MINVDQMSREELIELLETKNELIKTLREEVEAYRTLIEELHTRFDVKDFTFTGNGD